MPNFKLPKKSEVNKVFAYFSRKEWALFVGLLFILILSTLLILQKINKSFMVGVPMHGGTVSEGIVGTPRFINPVLAFSDADRDLTSLVYSGLMRKSPDGEIIPDLAEKYEISKNNLVYTFTLKENIFFQDGTPVTADDVIFTINKVKDVVIKSPYKANWDGVAVEKLDDRTIVFTLKQPYSAFLENTTLGILPAHIWEGTPIELNNANTYPIGSGPYMISKVNKKTTGIISNFELKAWDKFALGEPYIKTLSTYFYSNEDEVTKALEDGTVEQVSGVTPLTAENLKEENFRVESSVLPRIFGLFFNQNQNQLFLDKAVVRAIDQAIDKDRIIKEVLNGYGVAISDPIPPNLVAYQKLGTADSVSREEVVKKVSESLAKAGWVKNSEGVLQKTTTDSKKKKSTTTLEFSISTGNAPELAKSAELIKEDLEKVGMKVEVKTFEIGNLNQNVIRPRKYDALLFGEIINHESDLFAFWHSSQRKDPGLNVAMYTNAKVDKLLEDAFTTIDEKTRIKKYVDFETEIHKDMPAVFLYSPKFIYVVSKDLEDLNISHISTPADRFLNVYQWYTKTDNVWKIFSK
jgi:peptide/nickel transport system substrate-binding protein